MRTTHHRSQRASKRQQTRTQSIPHFDHLLLQLDATKLESDGLSFRDLYAELRQLPGYNLEMREVHTAEHWRAVPQLRQEIYAPSVVLLGHANPRGMRVAANVFLPWADVGRCLEALQARQLIVFACYSGLSTPVRELFRSMPRLERIIATPVLTFKPTGEGIIRALPMICADAPTEHLTLARIGIGALTGGQLQVWSPEDRDPAVNILADLGALAVQALMR